MITSVVRADFEMPLVFERRIMEAVAREMGEAGRELIRLRVASGDIEYPSYSTKKLYVSNRDRYRGNRRSKWASVRSRLPDEHLTESGRGWFFPWGYDQFKELADPDFSGRVDLNLTGEMWDDLVYKVEVNEALFSVAWETDRTGRSTRKGGKLPTGYIDLTYGFTTIESADIAEGITYGNRYNPRPRPFLFFTDEEEAEIRNVGVTTMDRLIASGYESRSAGGQFKQLPRNIFTIRGS